MPSSTLPKWLKRTLGLPGATSFSKFNDLADATLQGVGSLSALTRGELLTAGQSGRRTDESAGISGDRLAVVAESARRAFGFMPHREQLIGACALLSGHATEMDTGEGKTLTGAIAAAYHALSGRRIHVISINDYLAQRDAEWMERLYEGVGVTVGWISADSSRHTRIEVYQQQVVYASVSEIGYDVLRDRFATRREDRLNATFDIGIVDEADAVMIDEAMAPLVLAGADDTRDSDVIRATQIVAALEPQTHYSVDEDGLTVSFTEAGLDEVERRLGGIKLYSGTDTHLLAVINLALHARVLVHRDVDYLVVGGEIKLISASRGRIAALQRWPDGLHAAVEAKEGIVVSGQGVMLDTITIQDLLLRYESLAGMSGTVVDVAEDLLEFYKLPSGRVEPHRPRIRIDLPDVVFSTRAEMHEAVLDEIGRIHDTGQPLLIGTQSVAESEALADDLRAAHLPSRVLNARNDAAEAQIISRAGEFGAITISTQISGRGTDIVLGGVDAADRDRVVAAGGLAVVAIGHYPSRRLDAQLRGRSGRQGDPGSSRSFSSLEDDLVLVNMPDFLRTADSGQRARLTGRQRRWLAASAQRIAEGIRLDRHRSTWALNRAISRQREFVLTLREQIMTTSVALDEMNRLAPTNTSTLISRASLATAEEAIRQTALFYADEHWAAHLALLQEVRDGVHLRALAGEDPIEAFHMIALAEFDGWTDRMYSAVVAAFESPGDESQMLPVLRRPSATWTYMVSDNPLGDGMHRAMRYRKVSGRR